MKNQFLTLVLLGLASCSLIPVKKTQTDVFRGAEQFTGTNALLFKKVVDGEKSQSFPSVTVSGASNTVNFSSSPAITGGARLTSTPYHEEVELGNTTGQVTTSIQEEKSKRSVSIPLGVSLILAAVGLVGCVLAVRFAINSSATAKAVASAADAAMANRVRTWKAKSEALRDIASKSTDPVVINDTQRQLTTLQEEIAKHEAERGKLASAVH